MPTLTLTSGLSLLKQKAYESVHGEAIQALKRNAKTPIPYFLLGVIASDHNNHSKAQELFSKAVMLDPNIIEFHIYKTVSETCI